MANAIISKRTVDAAQPGTRDTFVWDTDISGFGLKVTPSGSKIYIFQYRLARPGQAERTPPRRYTIGKHGKLTPEQARKRAKELAAMVVQGIDPRQREQDERLAADEAKRLAQEQERLEGELAFENIADRWLDHYEHEKGRRPASVRQAKLVVENHLKPALTGKPFPHIGRDELEPIIDDVPAAQKAMRRTVFVYAAVLFSWAVRKRYTPANPLLEMEKPPAPSARDRVLSDDELAAVWRATTTLSLPFGPFFRLAILTGQRRSEVAGLQWDELDRSTAIWKIPADRAKNGKVHIVPLSPAAVAELDALSKAAQSAIDEEQALNWPKRGFVLTTTGRSPISGLTKAKNALDVSIAEERDGESIPAWRIHDLRRTLATGLQRLGVRFEVTEAVLNHISGAKGGVAGIYQVHDWADEKRAALEAWSLHVASIGKAKKDNNVVSLETARKSA